MTQNATKEWAPHDTVAEATASGGLNRIFVETNVQDGPLRLRDRVLPPLRLFVIRLLNYLTNYVVAYVPSFTLRRLWYRVVSGIEVEKGAGVHLRNFLWSYGPRRTRQVGAHIGRNTRIYHGCLLDLRSGLWIGDNVSISPEVMILAGTHAINSPDFNEIAGPVRIEDHVWLGARAIILPGVTVGRGAVVAAGAIVSKNVGPLEIVAGVPAKRVGMRDPEAVGGELDWPLPLFE
jgi:acetyltransferase-like isoleucine patch superfamily enzyme